MTRFSNQEITAKARELAEQVLMARITPLIGKDYIGKIPALRARIAAIRSGNGDGLPEVETAVAAMLWLQMQDK